MVRQECFVIFRTLTKPNFMQWILSLASDDIHHWQLDNENGSECLSFNRQWLSLRLTGTSKRLLFLRVQGLLQKKVLLQTEYGISLGETALADKLSAGQLILNSQRFFYEVRDDQLFLFDTGKQLLASCGLHADHPFEKLELYGLLFGFAWFVTPAVLAERKKALTQTV